MKKIEGLQLKPQTLRSVAGARMLAGASPWFLRMARCGLCNLLLLLQGLAGLNHRLMSTLKLAPLNPMPAMMSDAALSISLSQVPKLAQASRDCDPLRFV